MPKILNLTGHHFGRLVAVKIDHRRGHMTYWLCRCVCGKNAVVSIAHLRDGHTQSCGCFHKERLDAANLTHGHCAKGARSSEFGTWVNIRTRCHNPKNRSYKDYGGRGIFVCDEWIASFQTFFSDVGKKPTSRHTLGRKNNDGPYCKENCRWETTLQQGQNTRSTVNITCFGETHCRAEWSRRTGIPVGAITYRLAHGWTPEEALTTPLRSASRQPQIESEAAGVKESSAVSDPRWWLAD